MIMITKTGPEELLRAKAQLKDDLQFLSEEEEHLVQKLRIVEEKMAIQEIKDKIKAKRVITEQLKTKITELEKTWNSSVLEEISGFPPQDGTTA